MAPSTSTTPAPEATESNLDDINTLGRIELPNLPILKGEKDWEDWWGYASTHFECLNLGRFLTEDIKEPTDPEQKKRWLKSHLIIMVHLLKAISPKVKKDMRTLG